MKLGHYVLMLVVMMVVLEFTGISTGLHGIFNYFGITMDGSQLIKADIGDSGFFNYIFEDGIGVLIVLLGGGVIIIGLFAKGYDPSLIILPIITTTAILMIPTFWSIISYAQDTGEVWLTSIIATIFIGLSIGFIFSCSDYFAGR